VEVIAYAHRERKGGCAHAGGVYACLWGHGLGWQNNVESVLLFCAMLVAIAGIMFNSDQLKPGDDAGKVGRTGCASSDVAGLSA
jgi:hypothetical protein